jgi:hypothetical protein
MELDIAKLSNFKINTQPQNKVSYKRKDYSVITEIREEPEDSSLTCYSSSSRSRPLKPVRKYITSLFDIQNSIP